MRSKNVYLLPIWMTSYLVVIFFIVSIRKLSRYACGLCEDNPLFCVDPCFHTFHMNLGFGEGYHEEGDGDDTVEDDTDTSQYSMV